MPQIFSVFYACMDGMLIVTDTVFHIETLSTMLTRTVSFMLLIVHFCEPSCLFLFNLTVFLHAQPPIICWFQDATYELMILDSTTGIRSLPTRTGNYRGGLVMSISEAYDAGVDMERLYDGLVIITTQTGTRNATAHFSKCIIL